MITVVVGGIVFGALGLGWLARLQASFLVYPQQTQVAITPARVGINAFDNVTLSTADGLDLAAWYIPPPATGNGGAIIYAHGIASRRDHWLPELPTLYEAGYGGLLFSFRNHGASDGDVTTMGVHETQDVQAALDFLLAQPEVNPDRIMLVGDSFGAATGLMGTAQMPAIRGVVAVSPYSSLVGVVGDRARKDFRLPPRPTADAVLWWANRMSNTDLYQADTVAAAAMIPPRPVWLVHGEQDRVTPPISTERLVTALGGESAGQVEVWIVPRVGHSEMRITHADEFRARLLAFVDRVIGDEAERQS